MGITKGLSKFNKREKDSKLDEEKNVYRGTVRCMHIVRVIREKKNNSSAHSQHGTTEYSCE